MAVLDEPLKEAQVLKNYVDDEWVESKGELKDIVNPATGKTIARVPYSTKEEVYGAVQAANDAWPDWRRTTPLARSRCLFRLKELLEDNFEKISRVQTMEHGKCIDESRGETRRGIENVEVAAGIPTLMMGYNLEDIASGIDEMLIRQPLGVFTCIAPFNFPFMIPLWFAPYAVATGNCVIVKPSSRCPITQATVMELVEEAGFPPGVWNMVHGSGSMISSEFIAHPDVRGITFVGSTTVAKKIYKDCGEYGKRVVAQGGAKNFIVIMPDANLPKTVASLMTSFFGNAGQRCLAGANAVIVDKEGKFYQKFRDAFVEMASKIRVGYGMDEAIQMGPLQSPKSKERVLGYIESGIKDGAKLILDGRTPQIIGDYADTCFVNPTVFENVTSEMAIAREEIFGPVACLMKVDTLDEAIDMIHSNPYGNAASIYTASGKAARDFQYETQCGNIGINVGLAAPMAFFPFSGMKDSFFGILHGQGQEAVRFFTESKVVIERWW